MRVPSGSCLIIFLFTVFFFLPIKAQSEPDVEIVLRETEIDFDGNTLRTVENFIIQINSRAGEKYARIRVPFSGLDKVDKLRGELKDKNGRVVKKLKKSDIVEKSAISDISFYEDNNILEFILKHNSYPYQISYSYEKVSRDFIQLASWSPVLNGEVPVKQSRLGLNIPKEIKFRHTESGIDTFYIKDYKQE